MDPTNGSGPCDIIDDSSNDHQVGDPSYQVAVCLVDAPTSPDGEPAALDVYLYYDDTLNQCVPSVCTSGTCLDSNPDANAGTTTFGSSNLGPNFDCTVYGTNYPTCDSDPAQGPGHGEAELHCLNVASVPTLNVGPGVRSPIAMVRFSAIAGGLDTMTLGAIFGAPDGSPIVNCPDGPGECIGGTDDKTGPTPPPPGPTSTNTATPTRTSTPSCGLPGQPTCTPTPKAWTSTPTPPPEATATEAPAPPPPPEVPPPAEGPGPVVVPPSTGSGSSGVASTTWLISLLAGLGVISLLSGGLYFRRARMRR